MAAVVFICAVSVLAVMGITVLASEIKKRLYQKIPLRITLHARDLKNETEYLIRSLYAYYPYLKVTVIDDTHNTETSRILNALQKTYPLLFVIRL